jgi:phosphoribosylformimino-5-aminoimidazole carboxamide ribotide isomerase
MLEGTSNELYAEIMASTKVKLIASGGVSSFADVEKLSEIGCEGAIIGKAIYENKITLQDLRKIF